MNTRGQKKKRKSTTKTPSLEATQEDTPPPTVTTVQDTDANIPSTSGAVMNPVVTNRQVFKDLMSTTTSTVIVCAVCDGQSITQNAVTWCPDCDEAYCSKCLKHHGIAKATREHSVIEIEHYRELPHFIFEVKTECGTHRARCQLYCKKHECPCCIKCIDSEHKKCEDLLPLEDVVSGSKSSSALDDLQQRIGDLKKFFENIVSEKKKNSEEITKSSKKLEIEIKQFRLRLNTLLDVLEAGLLKSLSDSEKEIHNSITGLADKLIANEKRMQTLLSGITSMKQHASELQTFFAIREIEKEVQIEEQKTKELAKIDDLNIQTLSLTFDCRLQHLLECLESFGNISNTSLPTKIYYQNTKEKQAQIITERLLRKKLNLKKTFEMRKEGHNWCGGTAVLPNNKLLMLEIPVYTFTFKPGTCHELIDLDDDACDGFLVVLNQDGSLDRKVRVSSWSYSIAAINSTTVAVTSSRHPKIVIVNLQNKSVQKTINTKYPCYGITYSNDSLFYSCGEHGIKIRNLISGKVSELKIGNKTQYEHVAIHNDKIYISECMGHNGITCYDMAGKLIWKWGDNAVVGGILDLTVDKDSYVYGVGTRSKYIVIISANGKQSKYFNLNDTNDIFFTINLRSIDCCLQSSKLYVTDDNMNTKIYEIN